MRPHGERREDFHVTLAPACNDHGPSTGTITRGHTIGRNRRVYVSMWIESRIACSSRKSSSDVADRYWVRNTWR